MEPIRGGISMPGLGGRNAEVQFTAGGLLSSTAGRPGTWALFTAPTPSSSTIADFGPEYQQELQAVQDKYKSVFAETLNLKTATEGAHLKTKHSLLESQTEVQTLKQENLALEGFRVQAQELSLTLAQTNQALVDSRRQVEQLDHQQRHTQQALDSTLATLNEYKTHVQGTTDKLKEAESKVRELEAQVTQMQEYYQTTSLQFQEIWAHTGPGDMEYPQGSSVTEIVHYLIRHLKQTRELATQAQNKLKARGGTSVDELEREVLKLASERDRWMQDSQDLLLHKAEIGRLQAQVEIARQMELEKQHLESRCEDLEGVLNQKEKIITDLKQSLTFFQAEPTHGTLGLVRTNSDQNVPHNQTELTTNIKSLQELLTKFRNDYQFLHTEYVALRVRFGLDGSINSSEGLLKKSQNHLQQVSTIENETSEMLVEHMGDAAQHTSSMPEAADQELLQILTQLFSWTIQYDKNTNTVTCVWPSNGDFSMVYHIQDGKILLSQGLEARLLEEAPELLDFQDTLSSYIANITLLLSSTSPPNPQTNY